MKKFEINAKDAEGTGFSFCSLNYGSNLIFSCLECLVC